MGGGSHSDRPRHDAPRGRGPSGYDRLPRGGIPGYGAPPPPPPRRDYGYGRGYNRPPRKLGCVTNIFATVVAGIIVVFAALSVFSRSFLSCVTCGKCGNDRNNSGYNDPAEPGNNNNAVQNVVKVTKNKPSVKFKSDCVVDETGWFEDTKALGRNLEFVYEKLGIQPYVVFVKYNSSYATDEKRQEYCDKWYDEHIKDEDTFLAMYFSEKGEDEVGLFKFCIGEKAKTVGDKITGLFEQGINEYWFNENLSLDEVISSAFKYTSNHVIVQ